MCASWRPFATTVCQVKAGRVQVETYLPEGRQRQLLREERVGAGCEMAEAGQGAALVLLAWLVMLACAEAQLSAALQGSEHHTPY